MKKLILLVFIPLVFACGGSDGDSDSPCPNQPQLTTLEVSNIGYDENTDLASATFSGEIQNIQLGANCETFSITNQGFVYGTNIQPTTSDNVVNANGENASANVSDLMPETTYYVRAYLTNTLGTFYGNEVSFTTPESTNPVYLAENGVTIKAKDWAVVGDSGIVNGITYTIVNREILVNMIANQEDLTRICTTKVTDMSDVWLGSYPNFNQDISSWDVSNVYDMTNLFNSATSFNQPLNSWDVGNVEHMNYMFFRATSFNQPLNNWDVSNVVDMAAMFSESSFNSPIGDWDVSNVEIMAAMFNSSSFNSPIGDWDVSNVENMSVMFYNTQFNGDVSNWDVSNVVDMKYMFAFAVSFNQDLNSWNISNVTDCNNFCIDTPNWSLPKPNFNNCGDTGCD